MVCEVNGSQKHNTTKNTDLRNVNNIDTMFFFIECS